MTYRILLTPGDGIGPEVIDDTRRVLGWFQQNRNMAFETEEAAIGGVAHDTLGTSAPDATVAKAKAADAVLFGAVAGPNGTRCRSTRNRSAGCCACARTSGCSRTCGRRCASMR